MGRYQLIPMPLAVVLLCALLCQPAFAQTKPRSLYDGDSVMFENAMLLKPDDAAAQQFSQAHTLAPLIIQEVAASNSVPSPGAHGVTRPTTISMEVSPPKSLPAQVFFQPGSVQLNGREHAQMAYWWHYNQPNTGRAPGLRGQEQRDPVFKGGAQLLLWTQTPSPIHSARAHQNTPAQISTHGVRLTMNTNGVPVIYEVFGQPGSIEQIYVTQTVEAAARAELGPALPGRRHAVERSLNDAPRVVVPRVLDDPPVVMGPILYLHADTHVVATLICRCMDAQARDLVGQGFYELVPATASGNTFDATRLEAANPRGLRKDFTNHTDRLSRNLRLPAGF